VKRDSRHSQITDHALRIRVSPAGSGLVEAYRIEKPDTKGRHALSLLADE
jgi:hypothetical protein